VAIEQQNGDYNLYASEATVFNKTAATDGEHELEFRIGDGTKNLNAAASQLTIVVTVAGHTLNGGPEYVTKIASVTRAMLRSGSLFVASGEVITATLRSSHSSDTDVDVTVTPRIAWSAAVGEAQADALLNRVSGIETGVTPKQAMQRISAVLAGKVSGAGSGTEVFVGLDGVTERVTVTTDVSGNRLDVSYD
jgi:hypothetical protein